MNSSYTVTDLGAYSPVDFGIPVVTSVTKSEKSSQANTGSRRRSAAKAGLAKRDKDDGPEEFKVFIQPTVGSPILL